MLRQLGLLLIRYCPHALSPFGPSACIVRHPCLIVHFSLYEFDGTISTTYFCCTSVTLKMTDSQVQAYPLLHQPTSETCMIHKQGMRLLVFCVPSQGFHKILKKHDKLMPHAPCRQFYITHLHQQPWVQVSPCLHNYPTILTHTHDMLMQAFNHCVTCA